MNIKCLLLLLLLSGVTAQSVWSQTLAPGNAAAPVPRIKWLPRQLEVGKVPFGVPVTRDFIVENNSDSILLLTHVRTGCHCTTATWTLEPIPPGSRGIVRVIFDALKEGEFYKVIIVFTNQDVEQPMGLIFKGTVDNKPVDRGQ